MFGSLIGMQGWKGETSNTQLYVYGPLIFCVDLVELCIQYKRHVYPA